MIAKGAITVISPPDNRGCKNNCFIEKQLEVVETEDTLTLLENYIDEMELKENKTNIKSIMKSLYVEACSY